MPISYSQRPTAQRNSTIGPMPTKKKKTPAQIAAEQKAFANKNTMPRQGPVGPMPSKVAPQVVPYGSTLMNEAVNRSSGTSQASAMPTANAFNAASANGGIGGTGGTGGGMGAASEGGTGGVLDQDFTGWANGMRPDAANMMFSNPEAFLMTVMNRMGNPSQSNQGLYGMALPQTDYANALYMLNGTQGNEQYGSMNDALNFFGDFLSQGLTPGGQGVDFNAGLQNLMTASRESPSAGSSALADYLNMADPEGQVQAYKSLLQPLANASLHPLFANALKDKLGYLGNMFLKNNAFGASPPSNFGGQLGANGGIWGIGS